MIRRCSSLASMFLLLTAVLLLAACGAATPSPAVTSPAATATLPPRATILRVAFDSPVKLDPGFASSDSEIAILNAIYDYLVDIDANSQIVPRLASKWDVSADGLTYTFTLVPNVKFHDGTPLTAKDVVWTFDRLRNPNLQLPTLSLYTNI